MARQSAAVPVFEQPSGGEDKRIFFVGRLDGRYIFQRVKFASAAGEAFSEEIRRARMVVVPHRRLEALFFDARIFPAIVFMNHATHFFEHFGRRLVLPESGPGPAELLFDSSGKITN